MLPAFSLLAPYGAGASAPSVRHRVHETQHLGNEAVRQLLNCRHPLMCDSHSTGSEMVIAQPNIGRWLHLIQAEYREMPGLTLTKRQVCRFWSLDATACDAVLDALVDAQFLAKTRHDSYVLAAGTEY
jgi:hypothetical protein